MCEHKQEEANLFFSWETKGPEGLREFSKATKDTND